MSEFGMWKKVEPNFDKGRNNDNFMRTKDFDDDMKWTMIFHSAGWSNFYVILDFIFTEEKIIDFQ